MMTEREYGNVDERKDKNESALRLTTAWITGRSTVHDEGSPRGFAHAKHGGWSSQRWEPELREADKHQAAAEREQTLPKDDGAP